VTVNDALPLKAARRDAITKLHFWVFESELQTNPMPFHLDSLLMPVIACALDWGRNRILRVGKISSPTLSLLWTKVHEILG